MASSKKSKKLKVTVSLPAEVADLTAAEAASLNKAFKSHLANVLSGKLSKNLLDDLITNVARTEGGESLVGGVKKGKSGTKKQSTKG